MGSILRHDIDALLFRRQFIVGPCAVAKLPGWRQLAIADGLRLTAHPDLDVEHAAGEQSSVTTLGTVLDPRRPDDGASDVARRLLTDLERAASLDDFVESLAPLAGRFALIAARGNERRVVQDAAGMRQVYHTTAAAGDGGRWCASSPELLALAIDLEIDPAARQILDSREFARKVEYWWPGNRTRFRGVRLLLPNHCLDPETGTVRRYWPKDRAAPLPLEVGVRKAAEILHGVLAAAARRRRLAVSLTAGYDSRITLAACRDIASEVHFFSFVHAGISENAADIRVPRRLLEQQGLAYHVFECPTEVDPEFERIYKQSHPTGGRSWTPVAQALYSNLPDDTLRITSTVAEVARCFYSLGHDRRGRTVDGRNFAEMVKLGMNQFLVDSFDEWLSSWPAESGYDVYDLFYWEQRLGSWAGSLFSEWDLVQDGLSPFSCRELMETLLRVPEEHRRPPDHPFQVAIARRLWPEMLAEPINPPEPKDLLTRLRDRFAWLVRVSRRKARYFVAARGMKRHGDGAPRSRERDTTT